MKKTTLAAVTAIAAAGLAAFGAGYGRLALEHAAADALRRCEAAAPVRFSAPRISLLPPSATVERAVIRGPHGVLELRGLRLEPRYAAPGTVLRGSAAGGTFEISAERGGYLSGGWTARGTVRGVDAALAAAPWADPKAPVGMAAGRLSLEAEASAPDAASLLRPWLGSGRLRASLTGGTLRCALPMLRRDSVDDAAGTAAVEWKGTRITVREARLRGSGLAVGARGGADFVPSRPQRSALHLEVPLEVSPELMDRSLLPEALRGADAVRIRISGTPEKPVFDAAPARQAGADDSAKGRTHG